MTTESIPDCLFRKAGAIGFLIDDIAKQNEQFVINIYPGRGCLIEPIPANSCVVIGSGGEIPSIQESIKNRIEGDITREVDLYALGNSMRSEALSILKLCGPTSFSKLGISPCMAISSLSSSHFIIRGETIEGSFISEQDSHFYNFSFDRNDRGQMILEDHLNGVIQTIDDIDDISETSSGDVFDPERLTEGDDPSELFPNEEIIYLFEQWVIPEYRTVWRSIDSISFFTFNNKRICSPAHRRIIKIIKEDFSDEELAPYTSVQKHYFAIASMPLEEFESEIIDKLFDHSWLSLRLCNYSQLYTAGV